MANCVHTEHECPPSAPLRNSEFTSYGPHAGLRGHKANVRRIAPGPRPAGVPDLPKTAKGTSMDADAAESADDGRPGAADSDNGSDNGRGSIQSIDRAAEIL